MRRIALALTAGVACIATVAVIATSGSAQGPVLTSLHLVEKNQKSVGFGPTANRARVIASASAARSPGMTPASAVESAR